jgi:hypothetical protein
MTTKNYNTRTLAACAKRLRYILSLDPKTPCQIVWRYTEGFRLQLWNEVHEPTGCIWMREAQHGLPFIERTLEQDRADQEARDNLGALLECSPHELEDAELQHLSLCKDCGPDISERAFLTLCARKMALHPDVKRRVMLA